MKRQPKSDKKHCAECSSRLSFFSSAVIQFESIPDNAVIAKMV